jgi:hypothetical protein
VTKILPDMTHHFRFDLHSIIFHSIHDWK